MPQVKATNSTEALNTNVNHTMDNDYHPDFHGAAIIDEDGKEIPITEDMVQSACQELSNAWIFPKQDQQH